MSDQFDDLKQFIDSRISQSQSQLEQKFDTMDQHLNGRINDLEAKVDTVIEVVGERLESHDSRISKLERIIPA